MMDSSEVEQDQTSNDLSDVNQTPSETTPTKNTVPAAGNHSDDVFSVTNPDADSSPCGGKDSDSNSHSYVTLSPPTSPMKSYNDNVDPSVLESLEDNASSSDEPKSKLDDRSYVDQRKLLDLESPIAPGRDRNIKSLQEDEGQDVDLKVVIKERLKHIVKSDSYVSYRICTDTTRPSHLFEKPHFEVWRRYKDFEWLRDILEKLHYTLITPPLPGKQISRYFDHKSEEFLNERQKALDKFLKRLAAHPYFSFDSHFKMFLTADADVFSAHVAENTGNSLKILDAVSNSVKNATTYVWLKNTDPVYVKQAKYFSELGEKFGNIERVATRLHADREELSNTMEDFSSAMIQWATHEPKLSHPLQKVGTCVESCSAATRTLNQSNAYSMLMSSREYQLYSAAGLNAVRRRDGLQYEKERASDEREKKKKIHDDAAAAGKIQKLPKLAEDLQKASLGAEKALDDLSQTNEMLRVDIEKWGEAKNKEVCSLMKHVADDHVNYHQKCFDEWESVLKLLKTVRSSVPPEADSIPPEDENEHRMGLPPVGSISTDVGMNEDATPKLLHSKPVIDLPQETEKKDTFERSNSPGDDLFT